MSKRAILILLVLSVLVFFGCTQNPDEANKGNSDEYEFIAIAGTYELKDTIRDGTQMIVSMEYEFFLSGKITCRIIGYDSSTRQSVDYAKTGQYVCDKKAGEIAFQLSGADKPSLMKYYGKYIETNVAKFYLTGPNSNGGLAGNIVTVSYEVDGPGEVSGGSYQIVDKGGNASMVTAQPGPGAKFVEWSDGVTTPTRTDTGLNEDLNVKAKFIQETPFCTVKYIVSDEHGTIIGKTTQSVLKGSSAESVTANVKSVLYTFVGWSDGVTSAQRSDSNVTEDMEITAIFKRVWTVYYRTGNLLLEEEKQYVLDGEDSTPVTAKFEGMDCYFIGWSDGVETLTRQDKNVRSDISVSAVYADKLEINYVRGLYEGKIEGLNTQYIIPGNDASPVTAIPNTFEGYEFAGWSDGVTTATRQDKNIREEFTVYAIFRLKIPEYSITYIAGENGRIDGETSQTVRQGSDGQSVTAVPDDGYEFAGWSDGVTTATRQDKNIREEFTVYAIFRLKIPEYSITYIAGENGRIDGETSQTVRQGSDGQSVTAVPDDGYEFAGWSDGVTTATRQELNVQANITVTANFTVKIPENTVDFGGGNGSTVNPYKITNVEQLKNVERYGSSAFILLNDLEFPIAEEGTSNFKPLFSDENPFNGVFEGNGKRIFNITMRNDETFFTGLFAYIGADGVVKNLKLNNMTVSGTNYIGGVCGYNLGSITNCEVSVNISYIKANDYKVYVGGIAGRSNGCLDNNVSYGTITIEDISAENYVGGLTGYFEGSIVKGANSSLNCIVSGNNNSYIGGLIGYTSTSTTITQCYATGSVTVSGYNVYAGGLIGSFSRGSSITDCYATGSVSASGYYVYAGGLIGRFYGSITDCYTTGSVTVSGYYVYAGGLIGSFSGGSSITDCYTTGSVTVSGYNVYAGGLCGDSNATMTDCYATGSVSASGNYDVYNVYAGGLIGSFYGSITDCYATGSVTATCNSYTYAGGLVGYCDSARIKNSYSLSIVKCDDKKGAIAGYAKSNSSFTNVHWLVNEESDAVYAVGYDENLGIPTNTGTIKHTDVSDFYTLADTLNEGREEAVWENKDNSSLPTLIKKNKNKGE